MHSKANLSKICPVCGYPDLEEPAYDDYGCASFDICPSCGCQFGYNDSTKTPSERLNRWIELREQWINDGMQWWSEARDAPKGWDPVAQLARVNESRSS